MIVVLRVLSLHLVEKGFLKKILEVFLLLLFFLAAMSCLTLL